MELILCWSQYAMLPSFNSLWIAVSSIFVSILCSLPTMVHEVIVSLLGSLPFPTLSYLILISPEFIWIFLGFVGFCRIFEWKERVWEQVKIWLSPIIHTTEHSSILMMKYHVDDLPLNPCQIMPDSGVCRFCEYLT